MNLYVSNLDFNVQEYDLKKLFEPFGTVVSAKIITDRETGRSRGFGFVEMGSKEEGNKAIAALNDKELGSRNITVNEAREREKRSPRSNW